MKEKELTVVDESLWESLTKSQLADCCSRSAEAITHQISAGNFGQYLGNASLLGTLGVPNAHRP